MTEPPCHIVTFLWQSCDHCDLEGHCESAGGDLMGPNGAYCRVCELMSFTSANWLSVGCWQALDLEVPKMQLGSIGHCQSDFAQPQGPRFIQAESLSAAELTDACTAGWAQEADQHLFWKFDVPRICLKTARWTHAVCGYTSRAHSPLLWGRSGWQCIRLKSVLSALRSSALKWLYSDY